MQKRKPVPMTRPELAANLRLGAVLDAGREGRRTQSPARWHQELNFEFLLRTDGRFAPKLPVSRAATAHPSLRLASLISLCSQSFAVVQ